MDEAFGFFAFLFLAIFMMVIGGALGMQYAENSKPSYSIVIEEDGSGTQYINEVKVRSFPADTFIFDCTWMGNKDCGPDN